MLVIYDLTLYMGYPCTISATVALYASNLPIIYCHQIFCLSIGSTDRSSLEIEILMRGD